MNKHEKMPEPEKIKEILDIVSEKIPGLLKELSGLLYSPESAQKYAEALWKKARRHARRTKKGAQVRLMLNVFKELKGLEQYGVPYSEEKETEIKEIAYKKGVQFYHNRFEELIDIDVKRGAKAFHIAETNSRLLEMPLPQKQ